MIQAFSYVRFSTKSQATGTSLERQLNASKLFCQQHNLELSSKGYNDLGISGFKNVKRPELDQMLEAIQSGVIPSGSYILIEAIDRLSRKGISHTQDVLKSILLHDIKVAFVGEDAKTLAGQILNKNSLNDLSSVILVALAADLAHKESLRKSKLIKAAKAIIREKAQQGKKIRGHTMFWIDWSESNNKFVLNDKKSIIKEIVKLRLAGNGPRKIATVLNEQQIPSPSGKQWNHMTVKVALRSPTLYGAYQTHQIIEGKAVPDILIKDHYPAITNYETYLQLQSDSSKANKGKPSKANPFSGILKCSCGHGMNFSKKVMVYKDKPHEYEYHFCSASTEGRCPNKKRIRDLVPLLTSLMDKLTIKQTTKKNLNLEEIKLKEQKIEKLNLMLLEMDNPPLSVLKTIQKLEEELNLLLKTTDSPDVSQNDVESLSSINDAQEYNMHLKRIVRKIEVHQLDTTGKNLRIKVLKTDGHSQNFLIKSGEVLFKSDTEQMKNLLKTMKEA
ncbi:recombinase family protein [Pantoea sp. MBLJ3]|uniref:recombinase family protein n=1 Tax=Pantoea sp. MBLJ3 TaxID=1562889 RepID=UPI00057F550E|nr:recombinase family protein [Pantoea sp. MBLJ3]